MRTVGEALRKSRFTTEEFDSLPMRFRALPPNQSIRQVGLRRPIARSHVPLAARCHPGEPSAPNWR
eukprot:277439-Pyramimonas_sp.AAC.1